MCVEAIQAWFRRLYDETGINLTIFYDPWDGLKYLKGIGLTLELAVLAVVFSLVVGIVGAWLQGVRFAPLRWLVYAYIQFFRNTPPLAQLYFFYFGLGALVPTTTNAFGQAEPILNNFQWAVIALSFFAGAFNVEIFRSGIEAVPQATVEAARALGYSRLKAYVHIVLPLAIRICLPSLNNNLVNLVKTTAIAYAIAVPEALYVANQLWSDNLNVPEMMNVVLVTYLTLVGLFVFGISRIERALQIPGYTPS